MGLDFLGNPYENGYEDESDFEIERDEEWVVPVDTNLVVNRQPVTVNFWSLSDEASDFSLDDDDDVDDVDFYPEESIWDEDDVDGLEEDDEDNGNDNDDTDAEDDENDDEDNFQNPDDENYPQYDEIEDVFSQHDAATYTVVVEDNDDDFFDDEDDLDYVTYPIHIPKPPEQTDKSSSKTTTDANNLNSNATESTTNSTATLEQHDD